MNDGDFRTTVPAEWEEGPAEATIHIEPMASTFMSSRDATTTAGGEPECRDPWNLPLPSVTVPAQYQVDGMRLVVIGAGPAGLAAALGALHGRGLTHKDLTPDHVMIDEATGEVLAASCTGTYQ